MRKAILQLIFILACLFLQAQNTIENKGLDKIHLKNGTVIEGVIVKQAFGTLSLKITDNTTQIEKVKIFLLSDIAKIQKRQQQAPINKGDSAKTYMEANTGSLQKNSKQALGNPGSASNPSAELLISESQQQNIPNTVHQTNVPISQPTVINMNAQKNVSPDEYFDPFEVPKPRRIKRIWNRDIRGYRGFVDKGYTQGIGKNVNNRLNLGTSQGFQFNPIFYVGVGTSYDISLNKKDSSLPVFINPRVNFLDEFTTPFLDVRAGYSVTAGKGFYFCAAAGVSFTKKGKQAFNVALSYLLQNVKFYENSTVKPFERIEVKEIYHGVGVRLTYEY